MNRLLTSAMCGALSLSASAALASGGYITGDQSNPPRAVFSAPLAMAPAQAPVCNPCAPATTTYMPATPAPCTTCAPVVAQAPVAAPCTTCAPAVAFSPVTAAPCNTCAPVTACSPVVAPAPVMTYSPVIAFSPVVARPLGYAPVVATPVWGRRAIFRTPVVVGAAPVVYGY